MVTFTLTALDRQIIIIYVHVELIKIPNYKFFTSRESCLHNMRTTYTFLMFQLTLCLYCLSANKLLLPSAKLSRGSTICCLDTPLCTRDQDKLDSARRVLQRTCPLPSTQKVIDLPLGRAANYWSFNSFNCHYSYKLYERQLGCRRSS